jgi:hypothetical protein
MKSNSLKKFINNFINETENKHINESSDEDADSDQNITIRRLAIEDKDLISKYFI